MILLPFEKITYRTKLSPEEIIERLEKVVKPTMNFYGKTGFSFIDTQKSYRGNVERNSFQISRIINNKNSFLPVIKGDVSTDNSGTKIRVTMRPSYSSLFFTVIWMVFVGGAIFSFGSAAIKNNNFDLSVGIPVFMLVFAYGISMFGFKSESIKSKKHLAQLFEAETGSKRKGIKRKRYLK